MFYHLFLLNIFPVPHNRQQCEDPSNIQIASDSGKQIFKEISEKYSIIINDPNDIYNKLSDRPIITLDDNGNMMKPRLLKDMHEEEIEFKSSEELKIWDEFRK